MPSFDSLTDQVAALSKVLDERVGEHERLRPYDEGGAPIPRAVQSARMTTAYNQLMPASEAPWGSLVVDSVQDRLEVQGIEDDNDSAAEAVWGIWQDNQMDSESKLAHRSALLDGRAFALVWPDPDQPESPSISLDDSTQMVVQYREGSRRRRLAALRRWVDGDDVLATLYRPDGIWKFRRADNATESSTSSRTWVRRNVQGETWPLTNPLGEVPVVEIGVNRRLKPGSYPYARGEYANCTGLIDRINLLTFLGMVVGVWMGFPLRYLIGDRILKDDEGNAIPPFDSRPDSVAQFENPDARIGQLEAADRKNLSVFQELDQLAVITKTPRHYFPLETGMSNLSADAIRASEGGLHAKVTGHQASLGEGWEEVLRLAGRMLPSPVDLSPRASLQWADRESRSLAERADAASKLAAILPAQALIEKVLAIPSDDAAKFAAQGALNDLIVAAQTPAVPPQPVGNGNGAVAANQ